MYEILEKQALNPTVVRMTVSAPLVARKAEPGQFVILRAKENSERIPLTVADFDNFKGDENTIALSINSCGTKGAGELGISEDYFPDIEPGTSLPLFYKAKVAVSQTMKDATAATVIFTIASVD